MGKKFFSAVMLLCLGAAGSVLPAAPASAQLLAGFSTAAVETPGVRKLGGYAGITDDFTTLGGQIRYGVASSFDLGAKVAYVDFQSPFGTSLGLNADGKIQILDVFLHDPVDLAVGPEATYFRSDGVTNWYFGAYVAISKEYILSNGRGLTPYGRVGLRLHRVETDAYNEDKLNSGLGLGAEYAIAGYTSLWGEATIEDAGTGVFLGFSYELR
jgi:hypothetical protein